MNSANRSLVRGLAVLNCFRPGVTSLAHRDITERTKLPKATVTRLLETLRQQGFVVFDEGRRVYTLGVPVLSLARALQLQSGLIETVSRAVHQVARELHSLVGFGTLHDTDIVFLESVNGDEKRTSRRVGAGMRVPVVTTSVGRAYLAGLPADQREAMLESLSTSAPQWRPGMRDEIMASIEEVRQRGFCLVSWNEGRHPAISAPAAVPGGALHVVSLSYPASDLPPHSVPQQMFKALADLVETIKSYRAT